MSHPHLKKISKFLSFILRHQPDAIGLTLDGQGWAEIAQLLEKAHQDGKTALTRQLLQEIVDTNDKQRFIISDDGLRIRANQGHSINIDLDLKPVEPPVVLYHGTASRFMKSINKQGLIKGSRQHVHLSDNKDTARTVGSRHGVPVILVIEAGEMSKQGHQFYLSDNGVWLTDSVPVKFIRQK